MSTLGSSSVGPDRQGGVLPDKEVDERPRWLEDHAGGRQPQLEDQRHHPWASDVSHQVEPRAQNASEHDEGVFSGICSFLGRWSLQKCRLWYSDRQRCIFTTQPNPSVSSSCVRLFNNYRKNIYIYTPAQISVDLIELAKEKKGWFRSRYQLAAGSLEN